MSLSRLVHILCHFLSHFYKRERKWQRICTNLDKDMDDSDGSGEDEDSDPSWHLLHLLQHRQGPSCRFMACHITSAHEVCEAKRSKNGRIFGRRNWKGEAGRSKNGIITGTRNWKGQHWRCDKIK